MEELIAHNNVDIVRLTAYINELTDALLVKTGNNTVRREDVIDTCEQMSCLTEEIRCLREENLRLMGYHTKSIN